MLLERSRLQLDFIAKILSSNQDIPSVHDSHRPNIQEASKTVLRRGKFMLRSIEYIKSEHQNALQRMQSQEMVISNLIAQNDVELSMKGAHASYRDSSAMRTITFLGTLFLPWTLVAVRLTFQYSDLLFHTFLSNLHSKITDMRPSFELNQYYRPFFPYLPHSASAPASRGSTSLSRFHSLSSH